MASACCRSTNVPGAKASPVAKPDISGAGKVLPYTSERG